MLCKSPPSNGSGEAGDGGEGQDDGADEADICAAFRQKDRDSPWKIRA
jgi:hypothetical protein